MARSRVDDEEALIPRSDEEYHPTPVTRAKHGRCRCCSLKCCFFLFFVLVVATSILFYFVYPSVVNDNFNKFLGFACSYTQYPTSITCVIVTSQSKLSTQAVAIKDTWGQHCSSLHFIGKDLKESNTTKLSNLHSNTDPDLWKYTDAVFDTGDITAWYLVVDDSTYVAYRKLEDYLVNNPHPESVVLGADGTTPYIINDASIKAIRGVQDYSKQDIETGVKAANISKIDQEDNPLYMTFPIDAKSAILTTKNVSMFTGVTAEQMYGLYVTSYENA